MEASRASDADTASDILTGAMPLRQGESSSVSGHDTRPYENDASWRANNREGSDPTDGVNISSGRPPFSSLLSSRHLGETEGNSPMSSPALVIIGHSMGGVAVLHALSRSGGGRRCDAAGSARRSRQSNDVSMSPSFDGVPGGFFPRVHSFPPRRATQEAEAQAASIDDEVCPRAFDFSLLPFLSVITVNSPILPLPALSLSPAVGAFQRKLAGNLKRLFRTTRASYGGGGGETPEASRDGGLRLSEEDKAEERTLTSESTNEGPAADATGTREQPGPNGTSTEAESGGAGSSRTRNRTPRDDDFAAVLPPLTFLFTFSSGWQGGFVSPFVSSPLLSAPFTPPDSPLSRLSLARSERDCPYHFLPGAAPEEGEELSVCYWPTLLHVSLASPFLHGVFSGGDHVNILRSRPFLVFISSLLRWHERLAESVRLLQGHVQRRLDDVLPNSPSGSSSSSPYRRVSSPVPPAPSSYGPYNVSLLSPCLEPLPLLCAGSRTAFSRVSVFLVTLGQSLRFFSLLAPSSRVFEGENELPSRRLSSSHSSAPLLFSPLGAAHPLSLIQSQKYHTLRLLKQEGHFPPVLRWRQEFAGPGNTRGTAEELSSTETTRPDDDIGGASQGTLRRLSVAPGTFSFSFRQAVEGPPSPLGIPEFCRWIEEASTGFERTPPRRKDRRTTGEQGGADQLGGRSGEEQEQVLSWQAAGSSLPGGDAEGTGGKRGFVSADRDNTVCTPRLWLWGLLLEKAAVLLRDARSEKERRVKRQNVLNSVPSDVSPLLTVERRGDARESRALREDRQKVEEAVQREERGESGRVLLLVDHGVTDQWNSCSICSRDRVNDHREWYESIFWREGSGWGDACRRHLARVAWLRRGLGWSRASRGGAEAEAWWERLEAGTENEEEEGEAGSGDGAAQQECQEGHGASLKERMLPSKDERGKTALHSEKKRAAEVQSTSRSNSHEARRVGTSLTTGEPGPRQIELERGGFPQGTEEGGRRDSASERTTTHRGSEESRETERSLGRSELAEGELGKKGGKEGEGRQLREGNIGEAQPGEQRRNQSGGVEWDLAEWVGVQLETRIAALDEGSQATMNDFLVLKAASSCVGSPHAVESTAEQAMGEAEETRRRRETGRNIHGGEEERGEVDEAELPVGLPGYEERKKRDTTGAEAPGKSLRTETEGAAPPRHSRVQSRQGRRLVKVGSVEERAGKKQDDAPRQDTRERADVVPFNVSRTLKKEEAEGGTIVSVASAAGWLFPLSFFVSEPGKNQTLDSLGEQPSLPNDLARCSRSSTAPSAACPGLSRLATSSCLFASSLRTSVSGGDPHSSSLQGVVFLSAFTYPFPAPPPPPNSPLLSFPTSSTRSCASSIFASSGSLPTVLALSAQVPFQGTYSRLLGLDGAQENRPIFFDETDTPACSPPWPLLASRVDAGSVCRGCAAGGEGGRRNFSEVATSGARNEGKEGESTAQQGSSEEADWGREHGGDGGAEGSGTPPENQRSQVLRPRLSVVFETLVNDHAKGRPRAEEKNPFNGLAGDPRYFTGLFSDISASPQASDDPPLLVFVALENWADVPCSKANFSFLLRRRSSSRSQSPGSLSQKSGACAGAAASPLYPWSGKNPPPAGRDTGRASTAGLRDQPARAEEAEEGQAEGTPGPFQRKERREAGRPEFPAKSTGKRSAPPYCFYSVPPSVLPPLFYPVKLCSFLLPVFSFSGQTGGLVDSVCSDESSSPVSDRSSSASSASSSSGEDRAAMLDEGANPRVLSFRGRKELQTNPETKGQEIRSKTASPENAHREESSLSEDAEERGSRSQEELSGSRKEWEDNRELGDKLKRRRGETKAEPLPPLFYAVVLPHLLEPPTIGRSQPVDMSGKETGGASREAFHRGALSGWRPEREQRGQAIEELGRHRAADGTKAELLNTTKDFLGERPSGVAMQPRSYVALSTASSLPESSSLSSSVLPRNTAVRPPSAASSAGSEVYQSTFSAPNSPVISRFSFARSWLSPLLPRDPASSPFVSFFLALFVPLRVKIPSAPSPDNTLFLSVYNEGTSTEKAWGSSSGSSRSTVRSHPAAGVEATSSFPFFHLGNTSAYPSEPSPSVLTAAPAYLFLPAPPGSAYLLAYDAYVYAIPPLEAAPAEAQMERNSRIGDGLLSEKRPGVISSSSWPSASEHERSLPGENKQPSWSSGRTVVSPSCWRALLVAYESNPVWEVFPSGVLPASSVQSSRQRGDGAGGLLVEASAAVTKVHLSRPPPRHEASFCCPATASSSENSVSAEKLSLSVFRQLVGPLLAGSFQVAPSPLQFSDWTGPCSFT